MRGEGAALELRGLRKAFGEKTAVDGIDLRIERGTFFGLAGPNGAGKTTALSMAVLRGFTATGGTIVFSSHVMALVEQLCDHVAILAKGRIVAAGALDEVRAGTTLEAAFADLVGAGHEAGALSWFAS